METGSILKIITQEVEDFKTKQVQIVPGLTNNQYDILNRIYFYWNSKFTDAGTVLDPVDEDGDRMYFQNINRNPAMVTTKAIDFDTKNIRLLTVGGGDPNKTWFMERDLKYWMRDINFGKTLNRLFKELPIFGTVVLKIVDGIPYFVDLRNFVVEQSSETLHDSNYIIELHYLSVPQFRKVAKQMNWDEAKVKETINEFRKMKKVSHIKVVERYGEVPEMKDGQVTEYKYKRMFFADVGVDEYDQHNRLSVERKGVVLKEEEWDGNPYWEFHMNKMPGRWLGVGVVEALFEPQIRINELTNLQTKASYWAALRLWQTRDPAGGRNLSTEVKNGEVVTSDSSIEPINMDERNLGFFNDQYNLWFKNRDEMTFSFDSVQGERSPAGTTATEIQSNVSQNLTYFQQLQEDIALDVKEMIAKVIMPKFERDSAPEHVLRLVGQDLDQFAELVKNELVLKEMIRQIAKNNEPNAETRDTIEMAVTESIKQGKERLLTIPKNFYKGMKYDVDIDITGESVDSRVKGATKFAILQAITADPTMTTDPIKRKLLASYAEDGGLNPADFLDAQPKKVEDIAMQGRAGGGVSAPAMNVRVPGMETTTV